MSHALKNYTGIVSRPRPAFHPPTVRAAKRAEFIEIVHPNTAWDINGELWVFEAGSVIAVGAATSLDADPQTVSSRLAVELIRAGKAQAASIRQIEEPLRGVSRGDIQIRGDLEIVVAEDAA